MIKPKIENALTEALKQLQESGEIQALPAYIQIEATRDKQYGDFASNIAMVLAKAERKKPRDLAEKIIKNLPTSALITKVEIAGPGFINFFLAPEALTAVVNQILEEKDKFGMSEVGRGKRVLLEFVSSNPTGPLHVGHGRHAAVGDVLANLLAAVGFKPYREYYVNDAGRQMDILTVSVWVRYLALVGTTFPFPANGYQGSYINEIALAIHKEHKNHFNAPLDELKANLPADEPEGGDKEQYIDALIVRAKKILGDKYEPLFNVGLASILADIKNDLSEFGLHYDNWFSEKQFVSSDVTQKLFSNLRENGYAYEKDQALWFASSKFGDEKDRVLIRSNGERTYFGNDLAYHLNKFQRGFDIALDIMGSDHHGYMSRMKGAMQACGINPERLNFVLLQFVTLYRHGQQVQMSTRGGNFVTLRELREEVGNDAARYFYVMRKYEQHMEFDLDLAKSKSNENPVYYVQYAHARICSVYKQLADRKINFKETEGVKYLSLLKETEERELLNILARYPEVLINATIQYEPQQLTNYLRELATAFHSYYNAQQFLVDDEKLRDARLALITATRQVLKNSFTILGISAPETM